MYPAGTFFTDMRAQRKGPQPEQISLRRERQMEMLKGVRRTGKIKQKMMRRKR